MISFYKEKAQKPLKTLGFFSLRLHRYTPRLSPNKNYAKSDEDNDPEVVQAVYDYIRRARDLYEQYLLTWLGANEVDNPSKANPTARIVRELLSRLHEKHDKKLDRYYRKALQPVDQKSRSSTTTTSISSTGSSS